MKIIKYIIISSVFLLPFTSCEEMLDETIYSQLVPENFLTTDAGLLSVLKGAYVQENNVQNQKAAKGYILTQDGATEYYVRESGS